MAHMPSFSNPGVIPVDGATLLNVTYVITGSETNGGTDFMVPIGATMNDVLYGVYPANKGVSAAPSVDLPEALSSDRTITAFRVLLNGPMTVGDKLAFLVVSS